MTQIGIIGTGKIGSAIGIRLLRASFRLLVYDAVPSALEQLRHHGAEVAHSIEHVAQSTKVIWILVGHGAVQEIFERISLVATPGTVIIDAGNSYYRDSITRAQRAKSQNFTFLDCGTSGGIAGVQNGFCLMIGGCFATYQQLQKQWSAVAAPHGFAHVGASGAGHYVKMVHNAIEYGLLQAYAEGFALLRNCPQQTASLERVAKLWQSSSLIRSTLLEYYAHALTDLELIDSLSGVVPQGGTAGWALQEGLQKLIDTPVLRASIAVRTQSTHGTVSFATRLISRIRNLFGGHSM